MVKEGYVERVCPPLCLPWSRPGLNHSINGAEVGIERELVVGVSVVWYF
jgi:hypothetical protein